MAVIREAEFVVIGAGIAGVSLAARLAGHGRVILLEAEPQPAYHATGRSAAYFAPSYGSATVRAITAAGAQFFHSPPAGFSDVVLLRPRPALFFARQDQLPSLAAMHTQIPGLARLDAREVREYVPILSPDVIVGGLLDDSGGDLDVDAIVQGYLRLFRRAGGELLTGEPVTELQRSGEGWLVATGSRRLAAGIVINAAGAWADEIGRLADLAPLGLAPRRRSALLTPAPELPGFERWPLSVDIDETLYFKPDAGALLISPANEDASAPCDAQAGEMDIAIAVDRFERTTNHAVQRVTHRWAGLRTFAPDREFVVGFDPRADGFFWLAGQGGYGVQSAPGLADLAAGLVLRTGAQPALAAALSPARLLSDTN